MAGTADTEFALNDQYWCVHPRLDSPKLGTIVGLTDAPGKTIGLDLGEDVGGHNCDGRANVGAGLWVTTEDIYNETEWAAIGQSVATQVAAREAFKGNSFKKLTIDEDGSLIGDGKDLENVGVQKAPKNLMPAVKE